MSSKSEASGAKNEVAKEERASQAISTHLFVELTSLDELSFPTSSSTRIKYTCLDASPHYLAVGCTSGTVYIFSRYASKYRHKLSSVPVQVLSSKDGPLVKLAISCDEKYLACASRRGVLTVFALSGVGHSPTAVISSNCHVRSRGESKAGGGDIVAGNCITEIQWSVDSSRVYAGDLSGRVSCTRIQNRSPFRSASDVLLETDTAVVQIDVKEDRLLVSTRTRSCLCDLDTLECFQVGQKLRDGEYGAVFYPGTEQRKARNEENDSEAVVPEKFRPPNLSMQLIFASRPNGRLWEANGEGVVYSTHQYKSASGVLRTPVVSFKEDFVVVNTAEDCQRNVQFGRLHVILSDKSKFLLSKNGSFLSVVDPTDRRLVLLCQVEKGGQIDDIAVCSSDVFLLCEATGKLRKLSLFTVQKAVEKLHWRQCYVQASQVMCMSCAQVDRLAGVPWKSDLIRDVICGVSKRLNSDDQKTVPLVEQISVLQTLLAAVEKEQSSGVVASAVNVGARSAVNRLSTGIHRVVRVMDNSGYEDDFTFRAPSPLRVRSKSISSVDGSQGKSSAWKRRSLPSERGAPQVESLSEGEEGEHFANDRRKKLVEEAFHLLASADGVEGIDQSGNAESLRTLLGSGEQRLNFSSQVTLVDVPKDLAAAKKLLSLIANGDRQVNSKVSSGEKCLPKQVEQEKLAEECDSDFVSLFGRKDPLEGITACPIPLLPSETVSVERAVTKKRITKGARIVKAVKPLGKPPFDPVEGGTDSERREEEDAKELFEGNKDESLKKAGMDLAMETDEPSADETTARRHSETSKAAARALIAMGSNAGETVESKAGTASLNAEDSKKNQEMETNNGSTKAEVIGTKSDPESGRERVRMDWVSNEDSAGGAALQDDDNVKRDTETSPQPKSSSDSGLCCDHCSLCGMHVSWRKALVFGSAMAQMKVVCNEFNVGGVPSSVDQWREFFSLCLRECPWPSAGSASLVDKRLCDSCSSYFDFSKDLREKLTARQTWYKSVQLKCKEKFPSPFDASVSRIGRSAAIFLCPQPRFTVKLGGRQENATPRVRTFVSSLRNSGRRITRPSVAEDDVGDKTSLHCRSFPCFCSVMVSQLLCCMEVCEGLSAVIAILRENGELQKRMSNDDWRWLAVIAAMRSEGPLHVMPHEVVDSVLSELNVSTVKDVGREPPVSSRVSISSPSTRQPSSSVIISLNGVCAFCTISLKTRVSDSDGYVASFACGHSYHTVCLKEAKCKECLVCEYERRRMRQDNKQSTPPSKSRSRQQQEELPSRVGAEGTLTTRVIGNGCRVLVSRTPRASVSVTPSGKLARKNTK